MATGTWRMAGDYGGGFPNVGCFDPQNPGGVFLGADTWGLRRSDDDGSNWYSVMGGEFDLGGVYCRACNYSLDPAESGIVYIGIGTLSSGAGGYLGKITRAGKVIRVNEARGFQTDWPKPAGGMHPRPLDSNLILHSYKAGVARMFVADNVGVGRSTDRGATFTGFGIPRLVTGTGGPQGYKTQSFLDATKTGLVTASYGGSGYTSRVWVARNIDGAVDVLEITAALPPHVHSVRSRPDGTLWALCTSPDGTEAGLYRIAPNTGNWDTATLANVTRTSAPGTFDKIPTALGISPVDGTIYVGQSRTDDIAGAWAKCIGYTTDGVNITWYPWSAAPGRSMVVFGGTDLWWKRDDPAMGTGRHDTSVLEPSYHDANILQSFGRRGPWQTRNAKSGLGAVVHPNSRGANGGMSQRVVDGGDGFLYAHDVDWDTKRTAKSDFFMNGEKLVALKGQDTPSTTSAGAPKAGRSLSRTQEGLTVVLTPATASAQAKITINGVDETTEDFRNSVVEPWDVLVVTLADATKRVIVSLYGGMYVWFPAGTLTQARPSASVLSPLPLASDSASLRGVVNPGNLATTYSFQWGTTSGTYPHATPTRSLAAGSSDVTVPPEPITGLPADTDIFFQLSATNSLGTVTATGQFRTPAAAGGTPPAPPVLSGSAAGATSATLTWPAVTGATGYRIFRDGTQIQDQAGTGYTDTALAEQTTYTYTARAYNTDGESGNSNIVTITTPAAPVTLGTPVLTATAATATSAALSWTAVTGASSYRVARDGVRIATVTTPTLTFTDTGLAPGSPYTYTVRAVDAAGNIGPLSTPKTITTPGITTATRFPDMPGSVFQFAPGAANAAPAYIGDSTVTATGGGKPFTELAPGSVPIELEIGNANEVYWAAQPGDTVDYARIA